MEFRTLPQIVRGPTEIFCLCRILGAQQAVLYQLQWNLGIISNGRRENCPQIWHKITKCYFFGNIWLAIPFIQNDIGSWNSVTVICISSSTKVINILPPCWLVPNLRTVKLVNFFFDLMRFWRNLNEKNSNFPVIYVRDFSHSECTRSPLWVQMKSRK